MEAHMTAIIVGAICLILGYTIGALHGFYRGKINTLYWLAQRAGQIPEGMDVNEWIKKELNKIRE